MATIRKRGDLQWEARIRRKGWPVTCKTFDTKFDAEAWARQIESEMDRGMFVSRTEAENPTLKDALERYRAEYLPRLSQQKRESNRVTFLQKRPLRVGFLPQSRARILPISSKSGKPKGPGPTLYAWILPCCRASLRWPRRIGVWKA